MSEEDWQEQETRNSEEKRVSMPKILNTVKQKECAAKEGKQYTRKVVDKKKLCDAEVVKSRVCIVLSGGSFKNVENFENTCEDTNLLKRYHCSICSTIFFNREEYDAHVCDRNIPGEYIYSVCDVSFMDSGSLCAHSVKMKVPLVHNVIAGDNEASMSKPRETFDCKVCGKRYVKSYEEAHMAFHNDVNNLNCCICNKTFNTHSNLKMHMSVHATEKSHVCVYCKKGFLREDILNKHLKQHRSSLPYQCNYCLLRFERKSNKSRHELIHTGKKSYLCEVCGKLFGYCNTLNKHLRTHTGYRPYFCQSCNKSYTYLATYNEHCLTHSGERNYKCPQCPKVFKTSAHLTGHENIHKKPFNCNQCNRSFATLSSVRAHMKAHNGENKLINICQVYRVSYGKPDALGNHINELHAEEDREASSSLLPNNGEKSAA